MKKNLINEDIHKMMGLIGYNRSKTASEQQYTKFGQKPTLIKEVRETIAFENYDDVSVGYSKDANGNLIVSDDSQIRQLSKGLEDALDYPIDDEDIENVYDTYTLVNKLFLEDKTPACQLLNDYYSDQTGKESVATEVENAGERVGWGDEWFGRSDDDDMTFKGQPMTYGRAKRLTLKVIDSCGSVKWNEGQKDPDPDVVNEDLTAVWKDFPCVLTTIEGGKGKNGKTSDGTIWKWKNPEKTQVLVQIGDAIAVFGNGGRFVYKGPDYKDGAEILKGNYTCKGDELNLAGPAELSLSEGKVLTKKLISQIKNYVLSEQINFGGMVLPVPKVKDSSGAEAQKGGAEAQKGGGSSFRRTEVTYADVISCNGKVKKGDEGQVVKDIQVKLNKSPKVDPKLTEDGKFGSKTEAAIKQAGGTGVFDCKLAKSLDGEKPEPSVAGEEVTKQEENELDKVTIEKEKVEPETLKDQIADLEQAISQQPTKEACKTLIATAAAGLKKGVKLNNTSSLKQCYNSYNFGFGKGSLKVKKSYGIKGKGN
jgi:hypothetical protein